MNGNEMQNNLSKCSKNGLVARAQHWSLERAGLSEKILVGLNLRSNHNFQARAVQQNTKGSLERDFGRSSGVLMSAKMLRARFLLSSAGFLARADCEILSFSKTEF
ncbi:hypothetical protein CsSME_00044761 [Camellia sinensis var. sinensis]